VPVSAEPVEGGLRERSKRRRAGQILAAARALLRESPHEAPSVDRIAARAEVSPATVFNLIGPRKKLWACLAEELLVELERRTARVEDPDPRARARRIVVTAADLLCEDAPVYRHVLAHWHESGRLLHQDPTPQLVACLRAAREEGTLRTDIDIDRLGQAISTACLGAAHQWAAGVIDDDELRARCRTAADLAFVGRTAG